MKTCSISFTLTFKKLLLIISVQVCHAILVPIIVCAQYPTLVSTELTVRLDWSTYQNDARIQRVVNILNDFNNELYDVTDGQWRIRKFHVYDVRGPISYDAPGVANIHEVWETAHDHDKPPFTEDVPRNPLAALRLFKNPSRFHVSMANAGAMTHEFLHAWTGLLDEYAHSISLGGVACSCIMSDGLLSELCRPGDHSKKTEQHVIRGEDCYSWLARVFKYNGKGQLIIPDQSIPGPNIAPPAEIEFHLGPPIFWGGNLRIVGQKSKTSPAIASIRNTLYMVHLGDEENTIWFSRSTDGGVTWLGNKVIRGTDRFGKETWKSKSKAAPAIVAFGDKLVMVHIGDEENTIWVSRYNGTGWTEDQKIGQKSKATPALAVTGNIIHMVHVGDEDNKLWYTQSIDGGIHWSENKPIPGQKSKAAPALAAIGNTLYLVHLGEKDNTIWFSRSTDGGRHWTENKPIPGQKSKAAPALAVVENKLHMVHIGEKENDIWHSYYDYRWHTNVRIPDQKSKASPALVGIGDSLHMVHIGNKENDIWYSKGIQK